jgi:Flp pilus assembly pilin Flp
MVNAIATRIALLAGRVRPAAEDGQTLVEYSLIMALVGMALVVTMATASAGIEGVVQTVIGAL